MKLYTLDQCRDGWRKYACSEATAKIMQGWWLMQAQQHHAIPQTVKSAAGGRGKAIANFANGSPDAAPEGFVLWLKEAGTVGERTAYNYITAAQAAGLTMAMTEAAALGQAGQFVDMMSAQAGWTISSLYRKKDEPETPPEKKKGIAAKLEQMVFAWEDLHHQITSLVHSENFVNALPLLDDDKLQALEEEARHTLDAVREARAKKARKTSAPSAAPRETTPSTRRAKA